VTGSGLKLMAAVFFALAVLFGGLYLGDVSRLRGGVAVMEMLPLLNMVIAPWLIAAVVAYSGAVVAEARAGSERIGRPDDA
jgi:hypothetical protein